MGISDMTSKVLTIYKADTKPMRKELKKLSKEQQAQAKVAIEASEKQNDAIDKQIAMLGKVAIAAGAAVAAYKVAEAGIEAYQKRSRLAAATTGADLKGLQKATKGLVSETRLLEFASKAMNGTFKLSQDQMELALRGAVALRKTLGVELPHAMERMQQALTEGTTEPLKELGLVVKGVENDTREGLMAALGELAEQARLAGPDMALPGDAMAESQVKMADATEKLKIALGQLAIALTPVIAKLAEMVALVAQAAEIAFGDRPSLISQAKKMARGASLGDSEESLLDSYNKREEYYRLKTGLSNIGGRLYEGFKNGPIKTGSGGRKRSGGRGGSGGGFTLSGSQSIEDGLRGVSTGGAMFRGQRFAEANSFRGETASAAFGANAAAEQALATMRAMDEIAARQQTTMLAGILGRRPRLTRRRKPSWRSQTGLIRSRVHSAQA